MYQLCPQEGSQFQKAVFLKAASYLLLSLGVAFMAKIIRVRPFRLCDKLPALLRLQVSRW